MKASSFLFVGLVVALMVAFVGALGLLVLLAGRDDGHGQLGSLGFGQKVAVVEIVDVILESRTAIETLHRHRDNSSVRAIVVRLDTPGGAVAPSQEIYEELRKIRDQSGKPVVASVGDMAASGGYYIAAAASEIWANRGSITGSIGVRMQWTNYSDLYQWAKLESVSIVSGRYKAAGDPSRDLDDEERAYFQAIVDRLHRQFVEDVAEARGTDVEEIATLADGRIYTGDEAMDLGLIDGIGDLQDAIARAAELGGIEGEPDVIYPSEEHPGFFDWLGGSVLGEWVTAAARGVRPRAGFRFYYLW